MAWRSPLKWPLSAVVSRETPPTKSTSKLACQALQGGQVKAIRFSHSTPTSIRNFLKSPVFGPRPKLVRKVSAAEVTEITAAALAEHEAARRVNLEMAAAAYDEALELDPLAEGRAKGAAAGAPPREGIIARSILDQVAIQQQQLAEGYEVSPWRGDRTGLRRATPPRAAASVVRPVRARGGRGPGGGPWRC